MYFKINLGYVILHCVSLWSAKAEIMSKFSLLWIVLWIKKTINAFPFFWTAAQVISFHCKYCFIASDWEVLQPCVGHVTKPAALHCELWTVLHESCHGTSQQKLAQLVYIRSVLQPFLTILNMRGFLNVPLGSQLFCNCCISKIPTVIGLKLLEATVLIAVE